MSDSIIGTVAVPTLTGATLEWKALRLITLALKEIGEYQRGESLDNEDAQEALDVLNMMLGVWAAEDILMFQHTRETFSLLPNIACQTIGPGGNLNTSRPHEIKDAFFTINQSNIPLDVSMREDAYNALIDKVSVTQPSRLWYKPDYPSGLIYFYPVPDSAYSITITSVKPFVSLVALTDSLIVPPQYPMAVYLNLAILLCPKYNLEPSSVTVSSAKTSLDIVKRLNAHNKLQKESAVEIAGIAHYNRTLSNIFAG